MKKLLKITGIALIALFFTGCDIIDTLEPDQTPTKDKMLGVWQVTAVTEYDTASGQTMDILDTLNLFIPSFFWIKESGYISSSAGPLFLYLVYGKNNWTNVSSKIDQFFDYASLTTTDGRFWIGAGVEELFTPQLTLAPPGSQTIEYTAEKLLEIFGYGIDIAVPYIDHKFEDVSITFRDDDTMIWEWTSETVGKYNMFDDRGNPILWQGVDATRFSRCKMTLEKKVSTLNQLIEDAVNK